MFCHDPHPYPKDSQPTSCWATERYRGFDQAIKNFSVRPDDVYVISYPKTGTTFLSELICVLLSGLDFGSCERKSRMERYPYLELVRRALILNIILISVPTSDFQYSVSSYTTLQLPCPFLTMSVDFNFTCFCRNE